MPENIPEDVRQFILEHIDSIAQLEGLLLLRSEASSQYSAVQISRRLYISEAEAEHLLNQLEASGLLVKEGILFSYKPRLEALEQKVKELSEAYSRYLVPVTHLVHSKSKLKVQEFANAFRIRKDKD